MKTNILKRLVALCLSIALMFVAHAKYNSICVVMRDGVAQKVSYDPTLHISFDDNNMLISSSNENVKFEISGIDYFYYSAEQADAITELHTQPTVIFESDGLLLPDLSNDTRVMIHDLNGHLISSMTCSGDSRIGLDKLPERIIIITVGSNTYKITR